MMSLDTEQLDSEIKQKLKERNDTLKPVVWTQSMCRLFVLLDQCIKNGEPVLLVGETGCGKTTVNIRH